MLNGVKNILILTDSNLARLKLPEKVANSFPSHIKVDCYSGCSEDPSVEDVEKVIETKGKQEIDCVIGLGGGSTMDTAKVTAYLLENRD